jgi:hypothetical protein
MSAQHTPGPWSLKPVEDRSIKHLCPVDGERMSLLTIVHQDEAPPFAAVYKDADAHLIAAAPDLLEALLHIQRCIPLGGFAQIHHKSDTWAQIDAAIAKATGAA